MIRGHQTGINFFGCSARSVLEAKDAVAVIRKQMATARGSEMMRYLALPGRYWPGSKRSDSRFEGTV